MEPIYGENYASDINDFYKYYKKGREATPKSAA